MLDIHISRHLAHVQIKSLNDLFRPTKSILTYLFQLWHLIVYWIIWKLFSHWIFNWMPPMVSSTYVFVLLVLFYLRTSAISLIFSFSSPLPCLYTGNIQSSHGASPTITHMPISTADVKAVLFTRALGLQKSTSILLIGTEKQMIFSSPNRKSR